MKISSLLFSSFLLASSVDGFTTAPSSSKATTLRASNNNNDVDNEGVDSRRQFMSKSVATAFTTMGGIATMGAAGSGVLAPLPANAASGADKINARLRS
jgi:hypothetical protein